MTGLEWAGAVVNTVVELSPERFFAVMSIQPAQIAGLEEQGRLEVGAPANLVVFDPAGTADTEQTRSRSSNSPYLGVELQGSVIHTVYQGDFTFRSGSPVELAGALG